MSQSPPPEGPLRLEDRIIMALLRRMGKPEVLLTADELRPRGILWVKGQRPEALRVRIIPPTKRKAP